MILKSQKLFWHSYIIYSFIYTITMMHQDGLVLLISIFIQVFFIMSLELNPYISTFLQTFPGKVQYSILQKNIILKSNQLDEFI